MQILSEPPAALQAAWADRSIAADAHRSCATTPEQPEGPLVVTTLTDAGAPFVAFLAGRPDAECIGVPHSIDELWQMADEWGIDLGHDVQVEGGQG